MPKGDSIHKATQAKLRELGENTRKLNQLKSRPKAWKPQAKPKKS